MIRFNLSAHAHYTLCAIYTSAITYKLLLQLKLILKVCSVLKLVCKIHLRSVPFHSVKYSTRQRRVEDLGVSCYRWGASYSHACNLF